MGKVNDLGGVGVITDLPPADLPPNAFSMANNVRFANGRINRSMVFRTYADIPSTDNARWVGTYSAGGVETLAIARTTGGIVTFTGGTATDRTPVGWTPVSTGVPWSHTVLSGISIFACKDLPYPLYLNPVTGSNYAQLPGWPASTKAAAIRSYLDFAIALNLQEVSVDAPRKLMWSSPTIDGEPPPSWDVASPSELAGFNVLAQVPDSLTDGLTLGGTFLIYTPTQNWRMVYTGGEEIFAWSKCDYEGGIISMNCVVEAEGQHFVFGLNDIYVTDGVSKTSIAEKSVKDYIFASLNRSSQQYCFVEHNPVLEEVLFHYPSYDSELNFVGAPFCNKIAVFNYGSKTWSFMDAPNVVGASTASPAFVPTWATALGTWDEAGGTWAGASDAAQRSLCYVSRPFSTMLTGSAKVLVGDTIRASRVALPLNAETVKRAFVQKHAIDMSAQLGEVTTAYLLLKTVVPQAHPRDVINSTVWRFGYSDVPDYNYVWTSPVTFDPTTDYHIDQMASGRYLSLEVAEEMGRDFSLTAINADISVLSYR